ncbi:MAG: DEAD/DEAH box helicase [Bryobacterales bacterium]
MPALDSLLANNFSPPVRIRGLGLFRSGRVEIISGTAWEVEAEVQGSEFYAVHLRLLNNEVHVICSCPYYEGTGPCKHLWATILQAESAKLLRGDVALSKLVMVEQVALEELEDDDRDDGVSLDKPWKATTTLRPGLQPVPAKRVLVAPPPDWRQRLESFEPFGDDRDADDWPANRRLLYLIDPAASHDPGAITLEVAQQDRKINGDWSKPKAGRMRLGQMRRLPDAEDREILSMIIGGRFSYISSWVEIDSLARLLSPLAEMLVPRICATGRCGLRLHGEADWVPITWDDGEAWQPAFRVHRDKHQWVFEGFLRRGSETLALSDTVLISPGLVFTRTAAAPLEAGEVFPWLRAFRSGERLTAPEKDGEEFVAHLLNAPLLPPVEVPPELAYEQVDVVPQPRIQIAPAEGYRKKLVGHVQFSYDGNAIAQNERRQGVYDAAKRRLIRRDARAEQAALDRLAEFRLRPHQPAYWERAVPGWEVPATKLTPLAMGLSADGWLVEAEGKLFRQASGLRLDVSSGIDWFELHGEADFGEARAALPELLKALRRGEKTVLLDDGSYGLLPDQWLARLELFAGIGEPQGDHYRFRPNQAALLDVLLAEQPGVNVDEVFDRARRQLREFGGVSAVEQPAGVTGELRRYQREGLGWMRFLERFGFGGCLADDMGVGKTVQVLALLEARRAAAIGNFAVAAAQVSGSNSKPSAGGAKTPGRNAKSPAGNAKASPAAQELSEPEKVWRPSLAVVPRSLIFNWIEESARFTPHLRLKDHTGAVRTTADFADYDLILTTYGTLQRDIAALKDIPFEYVILDEAQAIKNPQTKSAKAARLLKANHRLALSGTPVENHLGELWSLFEFLNPGMLGSSWLGKKTSQTLKNPDEATRHTLARALRPFILRRTKEQVTPELPKKLEQTLLCEVQGPQRRLYNELRDHYRRSLMGTIDKQGLARSKMHVLEALLRLRQAACHPGLIDVAKAGEPSAKLDTLMPRLAEVLDEGHKALVFSQFTSMLAIVRKQLDAEKVNYEYLDGKTRDRQACVERFQNDPECRLFLISLKAGGLGLNLTAAEYVFLLDPWWNPAVEAQAIDRAHRIGQERPVFAYRLIAKDTVEEKILELQRSKRDLADAIITADNSVIGSLTREDLELLLS